MKAAEAAEKEEVGEEQLLRMKERGGQDEEEEESGEFVRMSILEVMRKWRMRGTSS